MLLVLTTRLKISRYELYLKLLHKCHIENDLFRMVGKCNTQHNILWFVLPMWVIACKLYGTF